jgi:polyribonucleotide nucleotidyltransferase
METDEKGRIKLSLKALLDRPEGMPEREERPRREYSDRPPRREHGDRPPRRERSDRPEGGEAPLASTSDEPTKAE